MSLLIAGCSDADGSAFGGGLGILEIVVSLRLMTHLSVAKVAPTVIEQV